MPAPRPVSPFLILLLGGAATALGAEWLRFGWSPAVAAAPAALGTVATLAGVARAYRSRRAWRRGPPAAAPGATTAADAAVRPAPVDADGEGSLRIRRLDGTTAEGAPRVRAAPAAPTDDEAPRAPAVPRADGGAARGGPAPRVPREAPSDAAAHERPTAPLRR